MNLSPAYNVNALVTDGIPFTGGGLDNGLNGSPTAYSADLIGVQQSIQGTVFYFGPPNAPDAVSGKTISLPAGQFTSLRLLATGVNGAERLAGLLGTLHGWNHINLHPELERLVHAAVFPRGNDRDDYAVS